MNDFTIPFARQELLHHILQVGGSAACELNRADQTVQAIFDVELTEKTAVISAELGPLTGQLTLRRKDRGNHLRLRDFLQDIANGRLDTGRLPGVLG